MSGFQPLFGGSTPPSPTPDPAASEPKPASSRPASTPGFQPMFGGASAPAAGRPASGFTPLTEALGRSAESAPIAPEPVDLEVLLDQARSEGRAEAEAEAEASLSEMQATVDALAPALDELARLRSETLHQAADDIAALVLQISRRVLGDSLALHPDALSSVVKAALDHVSDEAEVRILVSADDLTRVRDAVPDRREDHVEADPSIQAGCRIEARNTSIDATLDAAMEGIGAAVEQWRESLL